MIIRYFTFLINYLVTAFFFVMDMPLLPLGIITWIMRINTGQDQKNQISKNRWVAYSILVFHSFIDTLLSCLFWLWLDTNQSWLSILAYVMSFTLATSSIINTSHQLFHSPHFILRLIAWTNLARIFKLFYYNFHIRVHHKLVGTQLDPVTAKRGQSYYSYFFGVIFAEVKQNFKKQTFHQGLIILLAHAVVLYMVPVRVLGWFILSGFLHSFFMQTIQYIEHYSLVVRKPDQKLSHNVAWNNYSSTSNSMLFNFNKHSDHHVNSFKPYCELIIQKQGKVLPCAYQQLIGLALNPWEWIQQFQNFIITRKGQELVKAAMKSNANSMILLSSLQIIRKLI